MSNKRLTLADAMRTLTVTIKDDGYELESTAGKAFYSAWGTRGKVEGIPEYFPISLSVKDESNPVPKVEQSKAPPSLDEQVAAQAAQISNRGSSITKLTSDLAETNASITQKSTSCVGAMTSLPFSVPASSVNEQHIDSARINKGSISEAHICGNTIEQETLSAVLVHYLPTTNLDKASEHAVKLASAVKASFIELGCSTGGYVSDRNTAPLIFGERFSKSVIPVSTIKLNADGEGKQVSTLTVRVEMDASSVQQSLDEVESAISKHLATVLDKALKPGGTIWSAIKNHR